MVGVETGILRVDELGVRVRELLEKYHVLRLFVGIPGKLWRFSRSLKP
jgi:hypothetical protein